MTAGSDGALFPPTDVNALVDILADIDDNPQRWDGYGQQGTADIPKPFQPGCRHCPAAGDLRFAVEHPIERSGAVRESNRSAGPIALHPGCTQVTTHLTGSTNRPGTIR